MIRVLIYDFGILIICFIIFSSLLYFGIKTKRTKLKYLLYNISALFISAFIFEAYAQINSNQLTNNVSYSGSFFDDELVAGKKPNVGYGPKIDTNFQVTAIKKQNDSLIYKVKYSFKNGNRIVPNNNDSSNNQLFFLGGSFTFGDGLNDNQTLPYFINLYSNQKYKLSNYGFSGYGTHQALKIIENNIINSKRTENNTNSAVIYSFIPEHFERAAGYKIWDTYGPLYEVENNKLLFKGNFNESRILKENYLTKRLKIIWQNSFLFKHIFTPKIKAKDVIRVLELVKSMNALLKKKNIRFIVILGRTNFNNANEVEFYKKLNRNNIECYFVSSIIPNLNENEYSIIGDGHPNEKYNKELADFLINKLK